MAGRLSNLRIIDPVLTQIARGYTNADLIALNLFPYVPVIKEAGHVPQFGKEAFKIYNTERAIRADSNRINPEGRSTIEMVLTEHDLEYPMDYREEEEDMFDLEQYGTTVVTEAIRLRHEKLCADLVQNTATFASSNRVTLSGSSQWTNSLSTPIADIRAAKEAVRTKIGKYPNLLVLGATAFNTLQDHASLVDRIKYSQLGVVTTDLLATVFNIKKVVVGQAVYSDDLGNFADLWADNAVLAYVPDLDTDKQSMFRPSFAYTFRKKGQPIVDKYDEKAKLRVVRNTDIFQPKVIGAEAGFLIKDTNA